MTPSSVKDAASELQWRPYEIHALHFLLSFYNHMLKLFFLDVDIFSCYRSVHYRFMYFTSEFYNFLQKVRFKYALIIIYQNRALPNNRKIR